MTKLRLTIVAALISLALNTTGCAHHPPQLTLAHEINVPKSYRAGSENPAFPDVGVVERYTSAYDRGWWIAAQDYARDINYNDPSMLVMNGWPEEAQGGARGYGDARNHIEHLIKVFGKPKVSAYLQQFKQPDEDNGKDRHP